MSKEVTNSEPKIGLQELLSIIKEMGEQNKEAVRELAAQIVNPPPKEDEIKRRQQNLEQKIEQARMEEQTKEERRKYCNPQFASSQFPHRRHGIEWGIHNGSSVIAWSYHRFSFKDKNGRNCLTDPLPVGVCQWCHTDFRPGDPDYEEAISWGLSQVSTVPINRHTGIFLGQ